ncbi:FAD-binding domain-containing protein [Botrytis cinerea]
MVDLSKNRHTQIDMLALAGDESTKPSSKDAQRQASHSSDRILQKDNQNNNKSRLTGKHILKPQRSSDMNKSRSTQESSGMVGALRLRAAWKSPWDNYEKIYDLDLGGAVVVAVRKTPPVELVHVRLFSQPTVEKVLHMFRQIQHRNIVAALDAFTTSEGLFMILEHMPISLDQLVSSPAYPDEQQLAAILGQVLHGIAYLSAEGFEHGSLCCSNIFVKTNGEVKIANQECCHSAKPRGNTRDLRALSPIVMELMQKYVKEDEAIGIDDLHRWHPNSNAVGFLSATTSATSIKELLTVDTFKLHHFYI